MLVATPARRVSIPVLVNLRLGAEQEHRQVIRYDFESQFLFW